MYISTWMVVDLFQTMWNCVFQSCSVIRGSCFTFIFGKSNFCNVLILQCGCITVFSYLTTLIFHFFFFFCRLLFFWLHLHDINKNFTINKEDSSISCKMCFINLGSSQTKRRFFTSTSVRRLPNRKLYHRGTVIKQCANPSDTEIFLSGRWTKCYVANTAKCYAANSCWQCIPSWQYVRYRPIKE